MDQYRRLLQSAVLALAAFQLVTGGCGAQRAPTSGEVINLLAVLPLEILQPEAGETVAQGETPASVPDDAGAVVTAQIYGVLAERSDFRFVPDLSVTSLLASESVRRASEGRERALALGRAAEADAVIFGTVSRFRERVGSELGARNPAAVSFELAVLDVSAGEVVWNGRFEETQEALTSNLLHFWMFWRGGPKWLTASELSRIGVERLLKDMRKTVAP